MPYTQKYTPPHCFFCNFAGWECCKSFLGSRSELKINLGEEEDEYDRDSQGEPIIEDPTNVEDDARSDVSLTTAEQIEDYYVKQPRWHPPWQLKQVQLFFVLLFFICSDSSGILISILSLTFVENPTLVLLYILCR